MTAKIVRKLWEKTHDRLLSRLYFSNNFLLPHPRFSLTSGRNCAPGGKNIFTHCSEFSSNLPVMFSPTFTSYLHNSAQFSMREIFIADVFIITFIVTEWEKVTRWSHTKFAENFRLVGFIFARKNLNEIFMIIKRNILRKISMKIWWGIAVYAFTNIIWVYCTQHSTRIVWWAPQTPIKYASIVLA